MHFIGEHCSIYLERGTGFVWTDYYDPASLTGYGRHHTHLKHNQRFQKKKVSDRAKLAGVKQSEDVKIYIVYISILYCFLQRKLLDWPVLTYNKIMNN